MDKLAPLVAYALRFDSPFSLQVAFEPLKWDGRGIPYICVDKWVGPRSPGLSSQSPNLQV